MWSVVNFGKHHGKTLPQIVLQDPDWFFCAFQKRLFGTTGQLASEAMEIFVKARNIKIPKTDSEDWCIDYLWDPYLEFSQIRLIERTRADRWSEIAFRKDCIDLSAARYIFQMFSQFHKISRTHPDLLLGLTYIPRMTFYEKRHELLAARQLKQCKRGSWRLLKQFKHLYFGSEKFRLSNKQCEQFFDTLANFIDRNESPEIEIPEPSAEDFEDIVDSMVDCLLMCPDSPCFVSDIWERPARRDALKAGWMGEKEEVVEEESGSSLEEFL
jgi:hypothetical protein